MQILDAKIGLVDIAYYSVWQLSKALLLANQSFTTALPRVRSEIYGGIAKAAKAQILSAQGGHQTRQGTLRGLSGSMKTLDNLPSSNLLEGPANRWRTKAVEPLDLSFGGHFIDPIFADHAALIALRTTSNLDGDKEQLFDEHNQNSSE